MKKLLACVLAVAMILTLMPTLVVANNGGDDYIFFDDFSDSATVGEIVNGDVITAGTQWTTRGHGGTNASIYGPHQSLWLSNVSFLNAADDGVALDLTDFVIETEFMSIGAGDASNHGGIIIRGAGASGYNNFYGVVLNAFSGVVALNRGGYGNEVASAPAAMLEQGEWYDVRVVVEDARVEVFIDDESVLIFDELSRASGAVGAWQIHAATYYRNFRVSEVEDDNGGGNGPVWPVGDVIFYDDFTDPDTLGAFDAGVNNLVGGTHWASWTNCCIMATINSYDELSLFGFTALDALDDNGDSLDLENFVIETRIRPEGGAPHQMSYIVLRGEIGSGDSARDNAYAVSLDINTGYVYIFASLPYSGTRIARSATPVLDGGEWFDVTIVVHGDWIKAFVDGELAVSHYGLSRTAGRVGVYSSWSEARFSYFRVSETIGNPPPSPDPGDEPIFFDDFSTNTLGTNWVRLYGDDIATINDRTLTLPIGGETFLYASEDGEPLVLTDFMVETRFFKYHTNPLAGIIIRGDGIGNSGFYAIELGGDTNDATAGRVAIRDGFEGEVLNYAPNAIESRWAWYNVKIIADGSRIAVYIDGDYVVSIDNAQRLSGGVGVYVVWSEMRFQNFRISELPAPLPDLHVDGNPVVSRPITAGGNATVTANAVGIGAENVVMFVALFDDDTFVRAAVGVNNNGDLSASIPLTNLDYEVRYFIWNNVATMVPVPIW